VIAFMGATRYPCPVFFPESAAPFGVPAA